MAFFDNPVINETFHTYKLRGGTKGPETWYQENYKPGYPLTHSALDALRSPVETGGGPLAGGVPFGAGLESLTGSFGGGGGGGGGGASVYDDPRYWDLLQKQLGVTTGLIGQQQGFAQQGYGLAGQEAAIRKQNQQRLLDLLKQRQGFELPEAFRQIGNEAAARGSYMSQARIKGQELAQRTAAQDLAEASAQAQGANALVDVGLQQAKLQMNEELARLSAQRQQAELDYQTQLLRKK